MSDICERLRSNPLGVFATAHEAAREIERLRADLKLAIMSDSEECAVNRR